MFRKSWTPEKKPNATSLLEKAKKLHRQALRKRSQASIRFFRKSVVLSFAIDRLKRLLQAKFEAAIATGLEQDLLIDAQTSKGDCLFHWGQHILSTTESRPFSKLSLAVHKDALLSACALFQTAVESYKETTKGYGEWNLDTVAAVNCGNTLSIWAECCAKSESIPLLQGAVQCHRHALEIDRGDLEVQLHLSEVLIQLAEAFSEVNRREDSTCSFKEAMRSFKDAFQHSIKSQTPSDCTEVLLRWGIGCVTASEQSLDHELRIQYSEKAIQLIRKCIKADPGNPEAFTSLGHALEASAEVCPAHQTMQYLQEALEEGFEVAKKLIKHNNEAKLGIANVHLLLGKLHFKQGNDLEAKKHFSVSIHRFEKLLRHRISIGGFHSHCQALYNYACCCALAGKDSASKSALQLLLRKEGTTVLEIRTDKDLQVLSQYQWFQEFINKHHLQE